MNPDAKQVTVNYLLSRTEVTALVGQRIGTKTPPTTDDPWVRVHLIDDTPHPSSKALRLTHALLQIDCYSGLPRDGSQYEASLIGRTVRAVLNEIQDADLSGAVVSGVSFGGLSDAPDPDLDPARERTILQATLHLHA